MKNRQRVPTIITERSKTRQEFREDANINVIVKKWNEQGVLPVLKQRIPQFGDFSSGSDFHEAMNKVMDAQQAFGRMPAKVRSFCENDAGKFLDFVSDPNNAEKLNEFGILEAAFYNWIPEEQEEFLNNVKKIVDKQEQDAKLERSARKPANDRDQTS